ncbi:TetR family transcriptional regulator [Rhodococcus rhodnii]|uniref:TetR family transcriptional regulator n=2 Tax=Rhodococcus rhodnii TaxID=38312 RepID=R7WNL0_9NOCA|nr:TetR/AcrR family transcriptional regulator C-terminal domain-containing protein [Rhodococcus rhodnii]EOM76855.1 TetR family transcriptional regulator [Rhodococcus rhodnii LMG 5362]TXG89778.1 TetR family transcriptional regulator [Rhodococcus rhodnii]
MATRGSRDGGKQTRRTLLDAATTLFLAQGSTVSVAQICAAADAYPNQVTYYFGSKESLFVEAACGAVLRAGSAAEKAAADAETVREYTERLVGTLLGTSAPSVELFTTAMLMAGRRPELRERITGTLHTLHERGEQALLRTLVRTGWRLRTEIDVEAKAFWSAVFGVVIQKSATGESFGYSLGDAVAVIFAGLQIPDAVLDTALDPAGLTTG